MMKRSTRAIDVPKLRRSLKGRGRIAETMYYGGFAYVKLILLWLCCIALDLLIGFRFELLYPVWLLVRNCYDSFRFQGLVSSLQYSAFSAFFVCATVTTDLICFIFIPVQLLIFLASTYVWVLLVWQTAERGIGSAQLMLWIALVTFEYIWRYRGDSPLQLLRGSTLGSALNFLTGGLLTNWLGLQDGPSNEIIESEESSRECHPPARVVGAAVSAGGFLGGFGVALAAAFAHSSLTSDLCRPFAAHCIGYPVVTLGFGLKTYFRLWRVKRRQREVSRANEVYSKLLTEALPSLYEGPKAFSRFNGSTLHEHDQLEYESEICPGSLAICGSPSTTAVTQRKNSRSGSTWKQNGWKQGGMNQKRTSLSSSGTLARKERISSMNNEEDDTASSVSLSVAPRMYLWRFLWDLLWGAVLYISGGGSNDSPSSSLDDRISLSSNEIDSEEEMLEHEETSPQLDDLGRLRAGTNKKNKGTSSWSRAKGGRSRGRNIQSHPADYVLTPLASGTLSSPLGAACTLNNNLLNFASNGVHERPLYNSSTAPSSCTNLASGDAAISNSAANFKQVDEYYVTEELETLRNELQSARCQEAELRCTIQQYVNTEKQLKNELLQVKSKQEQSDNKVANMVKLREQDKSSMQLLEKRLIEAQAKKNELEKELNAEKRSKIKEEHAAARALAAAQSSKSAECGEACKSRKGDLERELRILRRDLKTKEESIIVYEEQLRQLRQYKENNDLQELQAIVIALREKNVHLEKSLSAENRLKQELFRALSEARTQMAEYQQQLQAKDVDLRMKDAELMTFRSHLSGDTSNSPSLSPSGDARTTVMNTSPGTRCSLTMSNAAGLKSALTTEQGLDMYTAALNNSSNGAYMPYSFASHNSQNECSIFDTPVTQSAQSSKVSSNSVSPPPPGTHITGAPSETLRYSNSKYGPTTAAN